MPEFTILGILVLALTAVLGVVLGWSARDRRAAGEASDTGTGWQERIEDRHREQRRLILQNRSLLEQVTALQASQVEATHRARALSAALKDVLTRRDDLQRQIRDIRNQLEAALAERRMQSDVRNLADGDSHQSARLRERDEKIFRLSRELESWQGRLPPLMQRFRDRDDDASRLESALDRATERILELEASRGAGRTQVESASRIALPPELDASNDALGHGSGLHAAMDGFECRVSLEATGRLDVNGTYLYDETDDLRAIKGVGPAIEKTLHELGIFRYSQIAEMSEFDIHRVAERLKGFRSRIYREDWIGQARELQFRRSRRTH